ncbi:hypothetical protein BJY04DRAFT_219823 [Aspergillus karnatakaensis]|uniref:uncharacterized protein n=1 Tax=Aspergillus karnatakaensis TaxID=1810916 RepID=UPI003CCCD7E9
MAPEKPTYTPPTPYTRPKKRRSNAEIQGTWDAQLGLQSLTAFFAIIVFSLAAAVVAKTPKQAGLYIPACVVLGVGVSFVVYMIANATLFKPRLDSNEDRPSLLYLLLQVFWFCAWGATGPLMFIYRDETKIERTNVRESIYSSTSPSLSVVEIEKRRVGIPVVVVVGDVQKMATACGAFGVICL